MNNGFSPSLMCKKLIDLCDTSLSRLSKEFESLDPYASRLFLGYLDSISSLIIRASLFIEQFSKNPNFK